MDTSNHLYGVQLKRWHPPYLKCASLVLLSDYMVFIKEDIDLLKKKRISLCQMAPQLQL